MIDWRSRLLISERLFIRVRTSSWSFFQRELRSLTNGLDRREPCECLPSFVDRPLIIQPANSWRSNCSDCFVGRTRANVEYVREWVLAKVTQTRWQVSDRGLHLFPPRSSDTSLRSVMISHNWDTVSFTPFSLWLSLSRSLLLVICRRHSSPLYAHNQVDTRFVVTFT